MAEIEAGLDRAEAYRGFEQRLASVRRQFLDFTASVTAMGRTVIGYGAAAKASTFLNYCGAGPETLAYIADRSSAKTGHFMPGSGIRIAEIDEIRETRPDFIVILPWNLRQEIVGELGFVRDWGARFVTAIPALQIF
jgi:hypothetical protein